MIGCHVRDGFVPDASLRVLKALPQMRITGVTLYRTVPTGRITIGRSSRHFVPGYHRFVPPGQVAAAAALASSRRRRPRSARNRRSPRADLNFRTIPNRRMRFGNLGGLAEIMGLEKQKRGNRPPVAGRIT
jgi:hypothetical protein